MFRHKYVVLNYYPGIHLRGIIYLNSFQPKAYQLQNNPIGKVYDIRYTWYRLNCIFRLNNVLHSYVILIHHNFPMFVFVMLYLTHLIGKVLLMYALYTLLHTIRYAFVNDLTFPEVRIFRIRDITRYYTFPKYTSR